MSKCDDADTCRMDTQCFNYVNCADAEPARIDLVGQIIRPGDVLIMLYDGNVNREDAERHRDLVMARCPGLADVVLLGRPHKGIAVYRPEPVEASQ